MSYIENKKKSGKNDETIVQGKVAYNIAISLKNKYGFSVQMSKRLYGVLYNDLALSSVLSVRIDNLLDTLNEYGYTEKEAINIIENNDYLLMKDSKEVYNSILIANKYGWDKSILLDRTIVLKINDKTLYALSEELNNRGIDPTEKNITSLFFSMNSNEIKALVNKYPLTNKQIFVLRYIYAKNMKNKTL